MREETMAADAYSVECGRCHRKLTGLANSGDRGVCPECLASERIFHKHLSGVLKAYSALELKHKRPSAPRPLVEIKQGTRPGRDDVVVTILRIIDRIRSRYREQVVKEDGTVLTDKDEDLTAHGQQR